MKWHILALILASSAAQAADVPFYARSLETQRDVSGINENFRSIVNDMNLLRSEFDDLGTFVEVVGSTMSGPLIMNNVSITLTGSNGVITGASSITASGFFGNGSGLTNLTGANVVGNISGAAGLNVLKAGDTMTGMLNVSSNVYVQYKVGIGSTVPTQPLVVVGSAAVTGDVILSGLGAYGRLTGAPLGVPFAGYKLSFNGQSQATRDDAAVVGAYYTGEGGAFHSWGSDRYESMGLDDGSDEQGHLRIGWGGAGAYTPTMAGELYSIYSRMGIIVGYNTSGNTKVAGGEGLAIEDSVGKASILVGNTAGRAWRQSATSTGHYQFTDSGEYGISNGGGTNLDISPSAGVAVSTSITSGFSIGLGGAAESLPTSGYAEGVFFYQRSNRTAYISTEAVTNAGSWKALY